MSNRYISELQPGKQLYLDESPEESEEALVSYHIVDECVSEDDPDTILLCLMRDTILDEKLQWAEEVTEKYPDYDGSVIDTFLNDGSEGFLSRFKSEIYDRFKEVGVRIANLKTHDYSEIQRRCYLPSAFELFGITQLRDIIDGSIIFDYNDYERNLSIPYWTRTPSSVRTAVMVNENGVESNRYLAKTCGIRPLLWIDRKYFEGDYVEDEKGFENTSFDLMYSVRIKDSKDIKDTVLNPDVYRDKYLNNSIQKPVEFAVSRFTPKELRGFARINRNLIYDKHILTVDYEQCTDGMFYSYYIDNREALIYGVSVDSDRIICKYVYRYLDSDLSVNLDESSISNYSPEQLQDFYNKGMQLKYFNDDLHLLKYNKGTQNRDGNSNDSVEFLAFSEQDGKIYKVTVVKSQNDNYVIDRTVYYNLTVSYELCKTNGQSHECNYNTEFLFDIGNDDYSQITYNGNILYTDKLTTNLTTYNGYYFDEFDTAIYKINVQSTGSSGYYKITRTLHKRIIKTVEINGTTSGIKSYTIEGIIDRSDYIISNVQDLYITYPDGNFDVWITVTAGNVDNCNVHFPSGTIFVKNQEFGIVGSTDTLKHIDAGRTREISIKNGVVVSMPHGEEWLEFDD